MTTVETSVASRVATVTLARGRVNALDEATVDTLHSALRGPSLQESQATRQESRSTDGG